MGDPDVIRKHIEIVEGFGGPKAVIAGSRIRVQDIVVWHEEMRMSPYEIVYNYPHITLADVYAALAYYWDNKDDIIVAMAEETAIYEQGKREQNDAEALKRKRARDA